GDQYHDLKEVVFIAIADFIMFPEKERYKSDHVILDRESHEHDLKDFSFTFIELPKFKKKIEDLSSVEEKWYYFFKHAQETSPEELYKIIGKDVIIEKAYTELDRFYWSPEALLTYEQAEKRINDYLSSLGRKFVEGKIEGKAEGLAEGLQKGKEEGAKKKQIEMAEKMLQKKRPLKEVVEFTDLELEVVEKIQAALNKTSSKSVRPVKSKARKKKN
ncbi:MAG: Rpn family recombination-promoting nuclease/putative transposase, partial [Chlamydiae bacterium]|nr:Rpn family recombination-promoting nuclease/putative transposase [Chlamydiota bacterium]